jgi:predicted  nucleic acid-binding Zn-ribbon protein
MKKKFISVAMFCALIASTPVWVGCSDYDDDIANLQSQVDALKQTVDVSTAEALKALQEAQAALQEDINALTAGKADAQAVKDLQETVAALQTAITENDITKIGELSSQVSELVAQVNGIEGDLDKTQSDLEKQKTELESKVNSLRTDLEKAIADKADQATVDSIKSELDTAVTNLTDVENRLVEVEKWIKNNGQELAKLTANVSQINNLIAKISEEAATTISDPAILAAIKALPTTVSSLTTLQQQIGKETEAGSILYRLAALEEWKNTIVTELLTGTGYSSFADICQDIKELQEALTGSGSETPGVDPSDPGLVEQFNALKAEMAKFDMIQSVVYIPNLTSTEEGGYLLKSSVLKVYNEKLTTADKYETVAQGIASNKIQFRVSPASKANDFIGENAKYTLTFDGSLISKKSFSKVKTAGAPVLVDAESGIIEYSVETEIGENEIWAVCAVIKAVDPQPAEGEESTGSAKDNTDLTTTYFKATRVTDKVKTIEITNDNSSATSLPYMNPDGSNSMLDYSKNRKVVGKAEDGSVIVEDMVGEYGVPTTISYELSTLTNDDKSDDNWFKIENGQLTLPNASNAMIGRKVTVTPVADFGSFQLKAPAYKEVTVARRVVEHSVKETKELTWNKDIQFIALSSDEMDEIIKATELSRGDFMELIDENEPADLAKLCLMTGKDILEKMPAATDKVANDNTLYIVVPARMNTGEAKKLDITLKEQNSSTTQTDSYIIHVNVSKMQYPVTVIEKNPTRWTEDGQTIEYRPQIEWADGTTDKVESVGNTFNAEDLFADYAALSQQAADLGFTLVIKAKGLTNTDGVSYNSATRALTYDKTQYNGKVVEFEIYLDYNGTKIGATNCKISVQALSGTWTNPTQMAMSVTDLSKTYDVAEGAKWVDVAGRTIWENGAKVKTGQDDKGNWLSDFSKDPFSTAVYGMTAPSFHVIDPKTGAAIADQYVNVDSSTGEVSFTDDAKQASFATAYTVTIRISADSPWGAITNMPDDHVDMTFTIAQGAK